MDTNQVKTALDQIQSSGFPLQIAVRWLLESNKKRLNLTAIISEYAWQHPEQKDMQGFVDLIATYENVRFVIECKRPRGQQWVFIVSKGSKQDWHHARVCCSIMQNGNATITWEDINFSPATDATEFCVLPNDADRRELLLERISRDLVTASEAMAFNECILDANQSKSNDLPPFHIYVPVIVTTADLIVCRIDHTNPSLLTAKSIDQKQVVFEPVNWIRFRKTLSTGLRPSRAIRRRGTNALQRIADDNTRTIFVVNASKILEFIEDASEPDTQKVAEIPKDFLRPLKTPSDSEIQIFG